jgi:hypothetical protein
MQLGKSVRVKIISKLVANEFVLNGTSSPCKSKEEGEVVGSKLTGCMCNLQINK